MYNQNFNIHFFRGPKIYGNGLKVFNSLQIVFLDRKNQIPPSDNFLALKEKERERERERERYFLPCFINYSSNQRRSRPTKPVDMSIFTFLNKNLRSSNKKPSMFLWYKTFCFLHFTKFQMKCGRTQFGSMCELQILSAEFAFYIITQYVIVVKNYQIKL